MTDYMIISKFRNKAKVEELVHAIEAKGKTCYNFCEKPSDPDNPDAHPEEQMRVLEKVENFFEDNYFRHVFEMDMLGLKNADKIILLLPAGNSAHIEAGIAYGLGKPLILIGEPEKPDTLYLIFGERYATAEDFLKSLE